MMRLSLLVAHRARRMMRNGSMLLVFDEEVKPVTKDAEGAFRGGNKMRLLKLGGSLALAKLADDSVDETIGASKFANLDESRPSVSVPALGR